MKFRSLEILYDDGKIDLSVIKNVENIFNIKFPSRYRELMHIHNNVSFQESCFDYYDLYRSQKIITEIGFDGFSTKDYDVSQDILAQYIYDDEIYGYQHIYSFGSTGNGDWICFDYREDPTTDEPKICIVIHDEYDEETGKRLLFPVANSFDEFLGMLYDFNERYPL